MAGQVLLVVPPVHGEPPYRRFTALWERSADSFRVAAEGEVFGLRGTLNAPLSAVGPLYHEDGLDVTFTSPDNDLEDMLFAESVEAGRCLVLVGDEVMFGWEPVLTAANRYRIGIMRGRRGTLRGEHAVGADACVVQLGRRDLTEWEAPKGLDDVVTLKLQPHLLQRELSLTEAPEVAHTITRRSLRPLGPANLTAQGDGVAPTYSSGHGVTLSWTLTSEDRIDGNPTVDYDTRANRCLLELWVGDELSKTLYVSKTPPYTISNASLVLYLGGEVTFTVRAYLARGGYRSLDSDTITVTKV